MKGWLKLLLATLVFWAVWAGLAGLALTVHGDCGVGATQTEAAICLGEKRHLGMVAIAIGVLAYVLMLWRMLIRRRRH